MLTIYPSKDGVFRKLLPMNSGSFPINMAFCSGQFCVTDQTFFWYMEDELSKTWKCFQMFWCSSLCPCLETGFVMWIFKGYRSLYVSLFHLKLSLAGLVWMPHSVHFWVITSSCFKLFNNFHPDHSGVFTELESSSLTDIFGLYWTAAFMNNYIPTVWQNFIFGY